MSSPVIDLTTSDDEAVTSQLRSKGKHRAYSISDDEDDTPTKHGPGPQYRPARGKRGSLLDTPSKTSNGAHRDQDSSTAPLPPNDSDDELDEELEFEEITQLRYDQEHHHRVAKEAPDGYKLVHFVQIHEVLLTAGTDIEIHGGDFLRIAHIFWHASRSQDDHSAYILRGILLKRNRHMNNQFPKRLNELVAIISMPMDDQRPALIAGLQDRPLAEFMRIRKIRFTNATFPDFSFRQDTDQKKQWHRWFEGQYSLDQAKASEEGLLVCRYKSVERWRGHGSSLKPYSNAFLTLAEEETDPQYRRANSLLLRQWYRVSRGQDHENLAPNTAVKGDLMDLFCGSGGASESARMAGVNVVAAVDKKSCAVHSHQKNHVQCLTVLDDVSDFIAALKPGDCIANICHSSCPYQFWSPVHTVAGKNDEANEAAAFMVETAAKKSGCRIMSFEQTPGFARQRKHRDHFHMFINQLTSMHWSVEWKIVRLDATSNVQARERLIVLATCPGQKMPEDVKPTHGPPGSGLLPYVTVRQALKNIPAWATLHDPVEQAEKYRKTGKPSLPVADWDAPLKHLITTSGPHALHPNGRPFTVREALRLQGFGDHYELQGDKGGTPSRTEAMTMIGDAVPPKAVAPYFASMKEALGVTDAEMANYKPEVVDLD